MEPLELGKLIETHVSRHHYHVNYIGEQHLNFIQNHHVNPDDDARQISHGHGDDGKSYDDFSTTSEEEFVEIDPDNRYGRYPNLIGKGAIKKVYRGFDKEEGIEVAWNQVSLSNVALVENEIKLLKTLQHKNIIKLYKVWVDSVSYKINFITELCSNTLLGFRRQHRHVCMKAVKDWARQILRALVYLHSHKPPIIHRDLKSENIFVNRSNGKIKVGDFGLATFLDGSGCQLVGTPEFMAPEMFTQNYNELVDVYAFGMCILELLTLEIPYKECNSLGEIRQKVMKDVKPEVLDTIKDIETLRFIRRCLAPIEKRPSAAVLLLDPFLHYEGTMRTLLKSASSPNLEHALAKSCADDVKPPKKQLTAHSSFVKDRNHGDGSKFELRLRIVPPDALKPFEVGFAFDCTCDTPESVADEMVEELHFPKSNSALIAQVIAAALASHMQEKQINNEDASPKEQVGVTIFDQHVVSNYVKALA